MKYSDYETLKEGTLLVNRKITSWDMYCSQLRYVVYMGINTDNKSKMLFSVAVYANKQISVGKTKEYTYYDDVWLVSCEDLTIANETEIETFKRILDENSISISDDLKEVYPKYNFRRGDVIVNRYNNIYAIFDSFIDEKHSATRDVHSAVGLSTFITVGKHVDDSYFVHCSHGRFSHLGAFGWRYASDEEKNFALNEIKKQGYFFDFSRFIVTVDERKRCLIDSFETLDRIKLEIENSLGYCYGKMKDIGKDEYAENASEILTKFNYIYNNIKNNIENE